MKTVVVTGVALTFVKQDLPVVPLRQQALELLRRVNAVLATAPQQPQLVPTNAELEIKEDDQ